MLVARHDDDDTPHKIDLVSHPAVEKVLGNYNTTLTHSAGDVEYSNCIYADW